MTVPEELRAISKQLGEIKDQLGTITEEIQQERDSRRNFTIIVSIFLVLMLILAGWNLKLDRDACKRSNDGRASIKTAFGILVEDLIGPNPTPELIERAEAFRARLDAELPQTECSWSPF